MAKIEMDVTEYDALRKNIKLAQQRADELKEAKDEISKLQQANIDTLKAAEKQVIYRKESYMEQRVVAQRSMSEIQHNIIQRFSRSSRGYGRDPYESGAGYRGSHDDSYDPYGINGMIEMFFKIETNKSSPVTESVTMKGLDEVREEIRVELEAKLSKEVQEKLARLELLEPQLSELKSEVRKLSNKVVSTGDEYMRASDRADALDKELSKRIVLEEVQADTISFIEGVLREDISVIFGTAKKLNKVVKAASDFRKREIEILNEQK